MYPPSFVALLAATIFIFSRAITSQEDNRYEACRRPLRCGEVDVNYPFLMDGRPSYCGQPNLMLACHDGKPEIVVDTVQYEVKNISYADAMVTVVDKAVLEMGGCPNSSSIQNLTNPMLEFKTGDGPLIVLLTGCSEIPQSNNLSYYEICSGGNYYDANHSYWTYDYPRYSVFYMATGARELGCSKFVKVGVPAAALDRLRRNSSAIRDVIKEGVELRWVAGEEWCPDCRNSGGVCGFNQRYPGEPTCFCSDGSVSPSCSTSISPSIAPTTSPGFFSRSNSRKKTLMAIIGASVTISTIFITILVFITICWKISLKNSLRRLLHWRKEDKDNSHKVEAFLRTFGSMAPKRYKYYEIKKMTDTFKVKLGQGGFGGVFKGNLVDGRDVAVKVLTESKGNGEEFVNEVASIGRTYHVNIVTLLGFCSEGPRRALVYEFMPNGSLEKVIYNRKQETANPSLGWEKLLKIAVGIARGLEYLHRGCSMRILHFDIKPHNILLDENYCPKISDFGLAKLCPNQDTGTISMMVPRGTVGYVAPEVFCRNIGRVSYRSDVYSYGMMMLEMAGGRKNVDVHVDNSSEIYFPHWVFKRIEQNESLGLEDMMSDEEEGIARKMIMVGLWCIQTDPGRRPSMSKVLEMLEGDVDGIEMPPTPFPSSSD